MTCRGRSHRSGRVRACGSVTAQRARRARRPRTRVQTEYVNRIVNKSGLLHCSNAFLVAWRRGGSDSPLAGEAGDIWRARGSKGPKNAGAQGLSFDAAIHSLRRCAVSRRAVYALHLAVPRGNAARDPASAYRFRRACRPVAFGGCRRKPDPLSVNFDVSEYPKLNNSVNENIRQKTRFKTQSTH